MASEDGTPTRPFTIKPDSDAAPDKHKKRPLTLFETFWSRLTGAYGNDERMVLPDNLDREVPSHAKVPWNPAEPPPATSSNSQDAQLQSPPVSSDTAAASTMVSPPARVHASNFTGQQKRPVGRPPKQATQSAKERAALSKAYVQQMKAGKAKMRAEGVPLCLQKPELNLIQVPERDNVHFQLALATDARAEQPYTVKLWLDIYKGVRYSSDKGKLEALRAVRNALIDKELLGTPYDIDLVLDGEEGLGQESSTEPRDLAEVVVEKLESAFRVPIWIPCVPESADQLELPSGLADAIADENADGDLKTLLTTGVLAAPKMWSALTAGTAASDFAPPSLARVALEGRLAVRDGKSYTPRAWFCVASSGAGDEFCQVGGGFCTWIMPLRGKAVKFILPASSDATAGEILSRSSRGSPGESQQFVYFTLDANEGGYWLQAPGQVALTHIPESTALVYGYFLTAATLSKSVRALSLQYLQGYSAMPWKLSDDDTRVWCAVVQQLSDTSIFTRAQQLEVAVQIQCLQDEVLHMETHIRNHSRDFLRRSYESANHDKNFRTVYTALRSWYSEYMNRHGRYSDRQSVRLTSEYLARQALKQSEAGQNEQDEQDATMEISKEMLMTQKGEGRSDEGVEMIAKEMSQGSERGEQSNINADIERKIDDKMENDGGHADSKDDEEMEDADDEDDGDEDEDDDMSEADELA